MRLKTWNWSNIHGERNEIKKFGSLDVYFC